MFGVQSLVFQHILKIQVSNYFVFLLSGLLPWIFIVQSMEMCTPLFLSNSQLLKSFQFNPLILLVAQLIDNLINFLAAFTIVFVAILLASGFGSRTPVNGLLFAPLAIAVLMAGVVGLCWLLATAQVFLRDTRYLVTFATSVMFFLTPIFYPTEFVPVNFRWATEINILYRLIEPFRITIYSFQWQAFQLSLLKGALVATFLLCTASWFWNKKRSALYVNF